MMKKGAMSYYRRQCIWTCQICNNKRNKDNAKLCETCGTKAPRTKKGIKIGEKHYFLEASSGGWNEAKDILSLLEMESGETTVLSLPRNDEPLEDRIEKVLNYFKDSLEKKAHRKESLQSMQGQESESEENDPSPRAALRKLQRHRKGHGKGASEVTVSPEAKPSLFEQVLTEAQDLVYDPNIGQFIDKKVVLDKKKREETAAPKPKPGLVRQSSHLKPQLSKASQFGEEEKPKGMDLHGLENDFNYVKFMKREKGEMTRKIKKLQLRLQKQKALQQQDEENLPGWMRQAEAAALELPGTIKKTPRPCALCERVYEFHNLPGVAPFASVKSWREKRGGTFDPKDPRLHHTRMYDKALLCIFCTQFFDKDFSEFVDYHRDGTTIEDRVLNLEPRESEHDQSESPVRSKHSPSPKKTDYEDGSAYTPPKQLPPVIIDEKGYAGVERPTSALKMELAMQRLKSMRDMPKLMENLGCELARSSNPANFAPEVKHDFKAKTYKALGSRSLSKCSSNASFFSRNSSRQFPVGMSPVKLGGRQMSGISQSSSLSGLSSFRGAKEKKKPRKIRGGPDYVPLGARRPSIDTKKTDQKKGDETIPATNPSATKNQKEAQNRVKFNTTPVPETNGKVPRNHSMENVKIKPKKVSVGSTKVSNDPKRTAHRKRRKRHSNKHHLKTIEEWNNKLPMIYGSDLPEKPEPRQLKKKHVKHKNQDDGQQPHFLQQNSEQQLIHRPPIERIKEKDKKNAGPNKTEQKTEKQPVHSRSGSRGPNDMKEQIAEEQHSSLPIIKQDTKQKQSFQRIHAARQQLQGRGGARSQQQPCSSTSSESEEYSSDEEENDDDGEIQEDINTGSLKDPLKRDQIWGVDEDFTNTIRKPGFQEEMSPRFPPLLKTVELKTIRENEEEK